MTFNRIYIFFDPTTERASASKGASKGKLRVIGHEVTNPPPSPPCATNRGHVVVVPLSGPADGHYKKVTESREKNGVEVERER